MGIDKLTGGNGKDSFVFAKLSERSDRIVDFNVAQGDQIVVNANNFGGGLSAGTLKSEQLWAGGTLGADDRFLYNRNTGTLSFDADGSGNGKAVQFAQLSGKVNLTSQSIFVL